MNPNRLLPDEIFPAAIRLIHYELMPQASPERQRALIRVARFLARAHVRLLKRLPLPAPTLFVGLLPPRSARDLDEWGRQLRRQREQCGMSRRQLARLSRVAASTIRNLETGRHRPSRSVVMRLQAVPALGMPAPPAGALIPSPLAHAGQVLQGMAKFSCSCWFEPEYYAIKLARDMMLRFNGLGGRIDQTFLYVDQASATDWCSVTAQEDYPQRLLPIDALADELAEIFGPMAVDVMGLGAGEAKEEVHLVQALLAHGCGDLRLFLLDISQPLLSNGYRRAARALDGVPGVGVFAIQGNFLHLPSYTSLFEKPARGRVLCMFGDTFCTLDNELSFLRHSLGSLAAGDLFLVDVPLTTAPVERLAALLQPPRSVRLSPSSPGLVGRLHEFLVGPFRRYVRDVQRISLAKTLGAEACLVPGSYAVDFRAHVQLSSGAERVFSVGGTSKRYDPQKLCASLAKSGWESLQTWRYAEERQPRGLFLFRKAEGRPD